MTDRFNGETDVKNENTRQGQRRRVEEEGRSGRTGSGETFKEWKIARMKRFKRMSRRAKRK